MADLTLAPDYVLETMPQFKTLISQFENGVEQRRPQRSQWIREFKLTYKNRYYADMNTILTLFSSKQGAFQSFTWVNPEDGSTYTVRFKEDSFTRQLKAGASNTSSAIYDFSFTLIEVLS
jgi:phage-related protein